jgi:predicted membrane channel-forming protein YqfA (hemolysin III family)
VIDETDYAQFLGAPVGGLLIYWIASRFTKNAKILAVIIAAVAVLDFVVRSYTFPRNRYLIFAIYCAVGWAAIFIGQASRKSDTGEQG